MAREPRWAEVTLHLEEPGSGDVIAPGGKIEEAAVAVATDVSVANSYSRGDREFEKATAMLFPSKVAQHGRMRDHTAAPFRRRVTV